MYRIKSLLCPFSTELPGGTKLKIQSDETNTAELTFKNRHRLQSCKKRPDPSPKLKKTLLLLKHEKRGKKGFFFFFLIFFYKNGHQRDDWETFSRNFYPHLPRRSMTPPSLSSGARKYLSERRRRWQVTEITQLILQISHRRHLSFVDKHVSRQWTTFTSHNPPPWERGPPTDPCTSGPSRCCRIHGGHSDDNTGLYHDKRWRRRPSPHPNGHADHLWKYERAFCLEEGLIGDCGWRVKGHKLQRNILTRLFEAADAE